MSKPIFIATHPNYENDDIKIVNDLIFSRKEWSNTNNVIDFEKLVGSFFNLTAFATDSARSALFIYLKSLELPEGSEVILPAFSCMVIANSVIWAKLKPVFVDCNIKNFNYDLEDLRKKVTPQTRVVLIQHTFGFPEDIVTIKNIIGKDCLIVEDLAHCLGGQKDNKLLGTLGDASILTFGIEKVISSIRGGMLLVKDPDLAKKIKVEIDTLPNFPGNKTFVGLLGCKLWQIFTPVYYWGFGKFSLGRILVFISHKLGLMGNMIEDCEYDTCKPDWIPAKMSPALATLGSNQFRKLTRLNKHRNKIASIYSSELSVNYPIAQGTFVTYLRFPLIVKDQTKILQLAKANRIVLGDWYKKILYAPKESLNLLGYTLGSCPQAEYLSQHIINLPTHININEEDAHRVADVIKSYLK